MEFLVPALGLARISGKLVAGRKIEFLGHSKPPVLLTQIVINATARQRSRPTEEVLRAKRRAAARLGQARIQGVSGTVPTLTCPRSPALAREFSA